MIKTFPKSRVCVIDVYPSFEDGLKKAIEFANQHNISLNTSDGRKLIVSFCLKAIDSYYKAQTSKFPKVACIGSKPKTQKIQNFVNNYFDKIMERLPVPYCGPIDLNSPDLEFAAQNSLKQEKTQRKFNEFALKLKLKPACQ